MSDKLQSTIIAEQIMGYVYLLHASCKYTTTPEAQEILDSIRNGIVDEMDTDTLLIAQKVSDFR